MVGDLPFIYNYLVVLLLVCVLECSPCDHTNFKLSFFSLFLSDFGLIVPTFAFFLQLLKSHATYTDRSYVFDNNQFKLMSHCH